MRWTQLVNGRVSFFNCFLACSSFSSFFHDKVETISTTLAIERSTIDPDLVLKLDPFQFGIFSIWYLPSEVQAWFGDYTSQETLSAQGSAL